MAPLGKRLGVFEVLQLDTSWLTLFLLKIYSDCIYLFIFYFFFYLIKTDGTRRNTSAMVFSRSRGSDYPSQVHNSVDFSRQEGGILRSTNELVTGPFTRKFDVTFDVSGEQTKIKDEENHNYNDLKLTDDNNASVGSLGNSSQRMLLAREDEQLQKTDYQDTVLLNESFDSAL